MAQWRKCWFINIFDRLVLLLRPTKVAGPAKAHKVVDVRANGGNSSTTTTTKEAQSQIQQGKSKQLPPK